MKKHRIECPHCQKLFEWTAPVKKREQKIDPDQVAVFNHAKKYWLDVFHPGWQFDGAEASSLKKLLRKIENGIKAHPKMEYSIEFHLVWFQYFCKNLPKNYKDQDLKVLNSKYNVIVEQMRKGQTPDNNGWHNKTSAERYANNPYRD